MSNPFTLYGTRLAALSLSALFSFQCPALAGPDETTIKLMNQSVSLLDWGVYLISEELEEEDGPGGFAFYNFEKKYHRNFFQPNSSIYSGN